MADNLLSRIPGQYVARALQTLPDASTVLYTHMDDDRRARHWARAYHSEAFKNKNDKAVKYFWMAERAVEVWRPKWRGST